MSSRIEYPPVNAYTGTFADASLERAYRLSTRPQALQLAAFIAVSSGLIWLASVSHELGQIDTHPAMALLIAWRVLLVAGGIAAAIYWLWRLRRPASAGERHVLSAWLGLYMLEIAVVSTVYLSLETTPEGLADRFLATSFWVTLTFGLVGIVTFHFWARAMSFGLGCLVWYLLLLAWFQPADLRPYLIGVTSMLVTLLILHFSLRILGKAGRRNFYLTRVLAEARGKAEEVSSVLSLLLTSTGHDARQPLFALDTGALALNRALDKGDLEGAREIADRQRVLARNVSHILTSVLELSRAERNLPGWKTREPVDVRAMLAAVLDRVEDMVPDDSVVFSAAGTAIKDEACRVSTSAAMVERILVNLLVNAASHAGATEIRMVTRSRRSSVSILVIDNGRGLAAHPCCLRSTDFFESRLTVPGLDSGYGLDLVFRMAQLIEASLTIRSRPGRGVVACLSLPIGQN